MNSIDYNLDILLLFRIQFLTGLKRFKIRFAPVSVDRYKREATLELVSKMEAALTSPLS